MRNIFEKICANNWRIEKLKEANEALRSQISPMLWVARDRDDNDGLHIFGHAPKFDALHGQWYDPVVNEFIELDLGNVLFPSVTFENSPVPIKITPVCGKPKKNKL